MPERIYPQDFPHTASQKELDSYCNAIDHQLSMMTEELEGVDKNKIPSATQREGLEVLMKLIGWANSLTGVMRYDVSADHTDCPEHDEWMQQKIDRVRATFTPQPRIDIDEAYDGVEMVRARSTDGKTYWLELASPLLHDNRIVRDPEQPNVLMATALIAANRFNR